MIELTDSMGALYTDFLEESFWISHAHPIIDWMSHLDVPVYIINFILHHKDSDLFGRYASLERLQEELDLYPF